MKKITLLGVMAVLCYNLGAQQQNIKPLYIGDAVTNLDFPKLDNYKKPTATFSDFNNQLVILDFWATWCVPCVKSLPHMQELQNKFNEQIQIILVTGQNSTLAAPFLKARHISLPSLYKADVILKTFPSQSVPHEVWIYKNKVIAITSETEVTEANIQKVLNDEPVAFVMKRDNMEYDINKPLLFDRNGGDINDLLYHSIITNYLEGVYGSTGGAEDEKGNYKFRAVDQSILRLYQIVFKNKNLYLLHPNRCIIEAPEPHIYQPTASPANDTTVRKYYYSFEIIVPEADKENVPMYMLQDLNRYFGSRYHIEGGIETRMMDCWVLTKTNPDNKVPLGNGTATVTDKETYSIWQNQPFENYFFALAQLNSRQPFPLVDETGISGNINLQLPLIKDDIPAVNRFLIRYGLQFIKAKRKIEMVLIKQKNI